MVVGVSAGEAAQDVGAAAFQGASHGTQFEVGVRALFQETHPHPTTPYKMNNHHVSKTATIPRWHRKVGLLSRPKVQLSCATSQPQLLIEHKYTGSICPGRTSILWCARCSPAPQRMWPPAGTHGSAPSGTEVRDQTGKLMAPLQLVPQRPRPE